MPANAVGTATPLYLSFETDDALGAELAQKAAPGHLLGSWYDAAPTAIVASPSPSHAGQALSFIKGGSADAWSGFTAFDGGSSTIYTNTANPVITMDYYSPSSSGNIPVELKLEVVGNPAKSAYKVVAAAPGWNTLTFDMSSGAKNWSGSAGYNRMALIPNFSGDQAVDGLSATSNNGQKYLLDNVSVNGGTIDNVQTGGPTPDPSPTASANKVYLSFESNDGNGANTVSTDAGLGAFNGGLAEIANVPTSGGHSGKGAKFTKSKSGDDWSGLKLVYGADAYRYTNAANKVITFDYYASVASPVQVKLETANGDSVVLTKSASQGWNALSFDMSTASGWSDNVAFNLVALFPNFSDTESFKSQIVPKNDQVFYVDNVSINGATISDVGTQPTPSPSASPTQTGGSGEVACSVGTPAIRLLAPNNSQINWTPTGYSGVWQYLTAGSLVGTHYFPLRSTIHVKYQALDSDCNPVVEGTKVYLAVNAAYSKAKTRFMNVYHGAVTVIEPIPATCAADQWCGEGQTVLEQSADDKGQVTFELTNLNAISPQSKPSDPLALPQGTMLLQSALSPSFSNYRLDPFTGKATGAGASNLENNEAVDVLWPNFPNGLGDVAQPADATVTPGSTKTLVYTIRNTAGQAVPNAPVTITTDDGGILTSPSSANAPTDGNGFRTVSATANSQGKVTVIAKSTKKSVQMIRVTYDVSTDDAAVVAVNGVNTITWGVAQTIGSVQKSVARGQFILLPVTTSKKLAVKWTTSTKAICKIASSKGVTKLTGIKKGVCNVTGTNAGNATALTVTKNASISVK